MYKKIISIIVIAMYMCTLTGCTGALRKKFVRKKNGEEKPSPVFTPESYETEFNIRQRYANHYAFWKNAIAECIKVLDQNEINSKKLRIYSAHALEEIKQMRDLLIVELRIELVYNIDNLEQLAKDMQSASYIESSKHILMKKLKHHFKEVTSGYSYSKMKNKLRDQES